MLNDFLNLWGYMGISNDLSRFMRQFSSLDRNWKSDDYVKTGHACAQELFKNGATPQLTSPEKNALIRTFTTLETIVRQNGIYRESNLQDLNDLVVVIAKLRELSPVRERAASPVAPVVLPPPTSVEIKLTRALENYWNTLQKHSEEHPVAELQEAAAYIVSLMPQVERLAPSQMLTSSLYRALAHAMVHSDKDWPQNLLPTLRPALLRTFVRNSLLVSKESTRTLVLLQQLCGGLLCLPKDHPLIDAFVRGFPSPDHLTAIGACRDEYVRIETIREALRSEISDAKTFYQLWRFVNTEEFEMLVNHLDQAQATPFLRNVFQFVGNFLEGAHWSPYHLEPMLVIADKFPAYRRLILEALSYTRDAGYLGRICAREGADVKLIADILARNPPSSLGGEDFFLQVFLREYCLYNPSDVALERVMEAIFKEPNLIRQNQFVQTLKHTRRAFIAQRFSRLDLVQQNSFSTKELVQLAKDLAPTAQTQQQNLIAIVKCLCSSDHPVEEYLHELSSILSPALNVVLLNCLADRPQAAKRYSNLSWFTSKFFPQTVNSDVAPLTQLSDRALDLIPFDGLIEYKTSARQNEDCIVWHLMRALIIPSDPQEKRLLIRAARTIFCCEGYASSYATSCLIRTMNREQMQQLPLEEYPKSVQFLLIFHHMPLAPNRETLRSLYARMSVKEKDDVKQLYQSLGQPHLKELVAILCDQPAEEMDPFWLNLILRSKEVDLILQLPRDLLMRNLEEISSSKVRAQLLNRLEDHEAQEACDVWWNKGSLVQIEGFPFARMIALTEDPNKVIMMVSSPLGVSHASELLRNNPTIPRAVLREIERTPWKLLAAIDQLNVFELRRWKEMQTYPESCKILNWYYDNQFETFRDFRKNLKDVISAKNWNAAFEMVNQADPEVLKCLLSSVWGPSPEGLAEDYPSLTESQLFAALFHPPSRENLEKALTSLADDNNQFQALHNSLDRLLLPSSHLPEEARKIVTDFKKAVSKTPN